MILNADHDSVLWAASAAVLAQLTICVACGIMCGSKSKKPVTPKSPQAAIVSPVASPAPVVAPVPRKEVKTVDVKTVVVSTTLLQDNADAKKVSKAKPKEDKPKTKEDKTKTKEDKPKTKEEKKPEKTAEPVKKQCTEEKTAEPKPDSGNRPVPKLIDDGQYANLVEVSAF